MPGSALRSVGSCQPENRISSAELGAPFGKPADWIEGRTGIRSLRRLDARTTLIDMAAQAACTALDRAMVAAADIDVLLVASCSANRTPGDDLAAALARRLGTRAAPLGINAACSGFCYALSMADSLIRTGLARHVLIVAAEAMSDVLDGSDLGTSIIFGDGAGAAVVAASDDGRPAIGAPVWGSDGARADLIAIEDKALRMRGPDVFRWAVESVPEIAARACAQVGVAVEEIDVFVPHQANLRITDAVVRKLRLRADAVVATDIVESGNTSAASIPIALDRLLTTGAVPSEALALLVGFGAGLAHAAQVVRLP